jgi:hypothetical protein
VGYRDVAAAHRGDFLEETVHHMLASVFGNDKVFSNVTIRRKKAERAAEADVLVVFGEFVIVVQAKSKRLTLQARSGDFEKIKQDFREAVQSAYDQALKFGDLVLSGSECIIAPNKARKFEYRAQVIPVVVLSDNFPSLSHFATELLAVQENKFPIIIDIFFLDALVKIINDPVEFIYYFKQRTRYFEKIHTDSEFNLLGFHLKHKLFIPSEYDFVDIGNDFSDDLDDYLVARELGRSSDVKFMKLEQRIGVPKIAELLSALKAGPPEASGAAIELLDFSPKSLEELARLITTVRSEVKMGKALKAFSFVTHNAGISYVAVNRLDSRARAMAEVIGERHKYKERKERWYVVVDDLRSNNVLDGVLVIWRKWEQSAEMDREVEGIDRLLKTTRINFKERSLGSKASDDGEGPHD